MQPDLTWPPEVVEAEGEGLKSTSSPQVCTSGLRNLAGPVVRETQASFLHGLGGLDLHGSGPEHSLLL